MDSTRSPDHRRDPGPEHAHVHSHSHGPAAPHPAQSARWSILRMPVTSRLAVAVVVSVALWAVVLLSMM
jgi:hypothetical protein